MSGRVENADDAARARPVREPAEENPRGQGVPGVPAVGLGPVHASPPRKRAYEHPTAGWGAARSVARVLKDQREPVRGTLAMLKMNHEDGGFDCPGCAWPDDRHGLHLDLCENGVKHSTWEMTPKRVGRDFFVRHTVAELDTWSDFDLEDQGRLTEPMVYDPASDKYVPIGWDDAFALVGDTLRGLDSPGQAAFYTSGRLGNEATFLYQLWGREFGTNNFPDCSNMCHEASGRALQAAIGTGKGTVDLDDWDHAEAIFVVGVNAASNAPRMLTSLAKAYRRGAQIIHVNPLREAASRRTVIPHEFGAMLAARSTATGTLDLRVRMGGDQALFRGIAKAVLEEADGRPDLLDGAFLRNHTHDFDAYRALLRDTEWDDLVGRSGVSEAEMRQAAGVYLRSRATIAAWCLGVTQQEHGMDAIREIVNLLLLRGNIGRRGGGLCPVRGHSNVQGNRTCGIDHRPTEEFLARLDAACGIRAPREHGLDTVATIDAMHAGDVRVFVGMGGNFAMAAADTAYTFQALRKCELTVHVSTKLNRSHLVHGRQALILPCLGRTERDEQAGGPQRISVEDSMSMVHLSLGTRRPPSELLRSEPAIIAGLARATLPASETPWEWYIEDYDRIRDTMQHALAGFEDFNRRVRAAHGFRLAQPARERVFLTPTGKAEFSVADLHDPRPAPGRFTLATVRSHDQWNTTIYSNDDRYRGLSELRTVVFLNPRDMEEQGLSDFDLIDITSHAKDGSRRHAYGYRAVGYDVPMGNAVGYMPELNVLIPHGDVDPGSGQPLMKQIQITIARAAGTRGA